MSEPLSSAAAEGAMPEGLCPGALLDGKYRLESLLGRGGMGWVFRARNEALDALVAVKVIRTDLEPSAAMPLGDRLLQEARAAAQLGHPAIARVYDFGITPASHPYLVMEALDGEDLASVLDERGRVKASKAVQTLLPIAHALATAHSKGIVHRDVKPANIFLTKTDSGLVQPKLIDFGVAKLERQSLGRVTLVGFQVGSPGYMSPEQARGEEAGPGADVWALGVVLYEMLAGRLPFAADNYNALMRVIIEEPHVPIARLGVADDELGALVERCLAKRRAERWSSMSEMGVALARWLADRGYTTDIGGASLAATWLAPRVTTRAADALESIPPARGSRPSVHWSMPLPPVGAALLAPAPVPSFPQPVTRTSIPVVAPVTERDPGVARGTQARRRSRWLSLGALVTALAATGAWQLVATDAKTTSHDEPNAHAAEGSDSRTGSAGYWRATRHERLRSLGRQPRAGQAR